MQTFSEFMPTRLHLWGNRLREFPVRFFRAAANLRELLLWDNELTALHSDTFAGLWNLRRLDLDRNFISELHRDAFRNLIELRTLHVAHNRVQVAHLVHSLDIFILPPCDFLFVCNSVTVTLRETAVAFINDWYGYLDDAGKFWDKLGENPEPVPKIITKIVRPGRMQLCPCVIAGIHCGSKIRPI